MLFYILGLINNNIEEYLWSWIYFKRNKRFVGNKNITNNYRAQANDSMFGYFCIRFIDFMLKGKCFLEYTNLFSLNE